MNTYLIFVKENEKAVRAVNPLSPLYPLNDESAKEIYYKASGY
jgi:hypothetical protein